MQNGEATAKSIPAQILSQMKKRRLLIFAAISIAYLISYFHRSATAVVGPELINELSLEPAALGLLGSMYFWAYAAAQLPAGILADTWGPRKTMSIFALIAAVGGVIFGLCSDVSLLTVGRFLVGLGVGFIYVPALRILTEWYRPDEMATTNGLLLSVGNTGAMISAAPLVLLMTYFGWRHVFIIVAAVTVVCALFTWVAVRNKPTELGFPSARELQGLEPLPPAPPVKLGAALSSVFSKKKFYLLCLLMFCYYGTLMSVGSLWAGPYLQHVYELSKQVTGNIIMMFPLGMVFGCPLAGFISDKIVKSRKKVLLGGAILHALAYIPLIWMPGELSQMQLYMLFLWYGLTGGAFVTCYACAKETTQPQFAGTAMGALNVFVFAGGACYQQVQGLVLGSYEVVREGVFSIAAYQSAMQVAFFGLIVGIILFMFFKEERTM